MAKNKITEVELNVTEIMKKKKKKEQEIRNLESSLSSVASNIGDWKIAKCMEYQAMEMEMEIPYDINELHQKRQAVRDTINQLQDEIIELQNQIAQAE